MTGSFGRTALEALVAAGVVPEIRAAKRTLVLERVARGGGATNWFLLDDPSQLGDLASRLLPGSSVSFYFDEPLTFSALNGAAVDEILRIAAADRDAVVGTPTAGDLKLLIDFVSSKEELDEVIHDWGSPSRVLYGRFPARLNESGRGMSIDLPDRDGVRRQDPH